MTPPDPSIATLAAYGLWDLLGLRDVGAPPQTLKTSSNSKMWALVYSR